jgi:hypothetical protein
MATRQTELRDNAIIVPSSLSSAAVFDSAFDMMKTHFIPLLLLVAIVFLPLHLIEQYIVSSWLNPRFLDLGLQDNSDNTFQSFGQIMTLSFGFIPTGYPRFGIPGAMLIFAALCISAAVSAVVTDIIAQRPISIIDGYRAAWNSRWQVVWFSLLAGLCCFAVWACATALFLLIGFVFLVFISLMPPSLLELGVMRWAASIYLIVCIVVPFMVTCLFYGRIFAFVIPVCVNERTTTMAGVARSQQLAACVPYRTTLLNFTMLPLMVLAVQFMLISGCNAGLQLLDISPQLNDVASTAICALIVCLLNAYWMVYIARLYYDCRVKRECFDIRMLMATAFAKDLKNNLEKDSGN